MSKQMHSPIKMNKKLWKEYSKYSNNYLKNNKRSKKIYLNALIDARLSQKSKKLGMRLHNNRNILRANQELGCRGFRMQPIRRCYG